MGIYGEKTDGTEVLLGVLSLGQALQPGQLTEAFSIDLDVEDAQDYVRWFVYVDDTGLANECDEEDNKLDFDLSDICWEATDSGSDSSESGGADSGQQPAESGSSETGSQDSGSSSESN